MTIAAIKEKLHAYVDSANDADAVEILSFIEEDLTDRTAPWDDKDFVAEMNRRLQDFKSGKEKGIPWEEVKRQANEITR